VLSSFKGYDAQLLRSLALKSSGLDLETEIVAKISQKQEYVMEVPVDFKPRTRQQGKKTGAMDGLNALKALFLYRIKG
jgi:dolichol-phosphate mannosyltransferase